MQVKFEKLTSGKEQTFLFKDIKLQRFTSPIHVHDEYELILIKRSNGKLFVGSEVLNFDDHTIWFFAPGVSHCFYNSPGYEECGEPAHAVLVQFSKDFFSEAFLSAVENVDLHKLMQKSESGIQFIKPSDKIIEKFISIGKFKGFKAIVSFMELLDMLIHHKAKTALTQNGFPAGDFLRESKVISDIYRYVAENFQNEISFSKAASIANMQRAAFCRYFARKTKRTFSRFVNDVRICHAQKLLAETDSSISEICYNCGYDSASYFYRQFKSITGYSPSEFKEQCKMIES